MSGIAVMFRSSPACRRGAACDAGRTAVSAVFIESGTYLKEFRKILSTSDARTERLRCLFEPNEENRPMAPDQLTFAQPASMLFPFPTEGVAV